LGKKKWKGAAPAWAAAGVAGVVALRSLVPDSSRGLFLKAQRLENSGQFRLALRHYAVLSDRHPDSAYAPRALERRAAILASLGRSSGDAATLRQAVALYRQLGEVYTTSSLAGEALVAAASIAFVDLRDWKEAKELYSELLARFPNSREYAPLAMVKLGRVALEQREREAARDWFQKVIQRFPKLAERGAEAQYHLGVAYETLWKDKQHRQWASNAYEITVKRYPQSLFAANARERLGLLFYDQASRQPSSRRVLIDVPPIPDDDTDAEDFPDASDGGSLWSALRLLLASRGLDVDAVALRGWSLKPFAAGIDPQNPARVVAVSSSDWENILAGAGLRYLPVSGGKASESLRDLQKELDLARPPLLFHGRWSLAVGYDSDRNLVFLQSRGARLESVSTAELARSWNVDAPIGNRFAMIGAWAPGEKPQVAPDRTIQSVRNRYDAKPGPRVLPDTPPPVATPAPTATPLPRLDIATYIYALPPLSLEDANRRALRRGGARLAQGRLGRALLNAEALDFVAQALERAARPAATRPLGTPATSPRNLATPSPAKAPTASPAEVPARVEGEPTPAPQESPELDGGFEEQSAPARGGGDEQTRFFQTGQARLRFSRAAGVERVGAERAPAVLFVQALSARDRLKLEANTGASPAPTPAPATGARLALRLRPWFGEPLDAWILARRDAIAFCEQVGSRGGARGTEAARAMRDSILALEAARAALPRVGALRAQIGAREVDAPTRSGLLETARLLRAARDAERQAVALLRR
jgi:TolA-binding protein